MDFPPRKESLPCIGKASPTLIHPCVGTHIYKRPLDIIPLHAAPKHTNPQVIIFKPLTVQITARFLHRRLHKHNGRMVKRIPALCKRPYFFICFRNLTHWGGFGRIPQGRCLRTFALLHLGKSGWKLRKFFHVSSYDCVRIRRKYGELPFAAIRRADIVTVHPGNQLVFTCGYAFL